MEIISKTATVDFSLAESGRLNSLLRWLHLDQAKPELYLKRSLALVIVTWLPLLILSATQGLAWGTKVDVNFLKDFS